MSDVTVVIGNYRGRELLPDCLASIWTQTRQPAAVIVVDADGSAAGIGEGVTILPAENRGLGYLYNRGAEASTTEHLLLLNNDVALQQDCIATLAEALDEDARRFAADPMQLDWSRRRVLHARTTLARGPLVREYIPGLHLDPLAAADEVVPTVCANGAAMLVRRAMFEELGGFDETFFMEWEDLDLCWRAWLRGWDTVYVPGAQLRHRVGAATARVDRPRRSASSHHNLVRFALKCLPAAAAGRVLAGELLRLPRHPRAVAVGFARVVAELPEIRRERSLLRDRARVFDWIVSGQPA